MGTRSCPLWRGHFRIRHSAGDEGTFLLCTFWLAQVLATNGRSGEARDVFDRAVRYVDDVGLLAEEIDSQTGEQLGNFP